MVEPLGRTLAAGEGKNAGTTPSVERVGIGHSGTNSTNDASTTSAKTVALARLTPRDVAGGESSRRATMNWSRQSVRPYETLIATKNISKSDHRAGSMLSTPGKWATTSKGNGMDVTCPATLRRGPSDITQLKTASAPASRIHDERRNRTSTAMKSDTRKMRRQLLFSRGPVGNRCERCSRNDGANCSLVVGTTRPSRSERNG